MFTTSYNLQVCLRPNISTSYKPLAFLLDISRSHATLNARVPYLKNCLLSAHGTKFTGIAQSILLQQKVYYQSNLLGPPQIQVDNYQEKASMRRGIGFLLFVLVATVVLMAQYGEFICQREVLEQMLKGSMFDKIGDQPLLLVKSN